MTILARLSWPLVAASLLAAAPVAAQVTFGWVSVGDPGNACDPQPWGCFGGVDYNYRVATHEVTNAQYVEFLNAKAASDPHGLYNPNMTTGFNGGILRSGSDGSYGYSTIAGREAMPVNFVSVFDAMRFVNWVHNGQGHGDTETGAYTMPTSTFGLPPERNPGAWIFLPSNDEWHKAAYYDADAGVFYDYPAGTDMVITCSTPTVAPNTASCGGVAGLTPVGSYPGSPSPSGTFDQAGNIQEWTETEVEDIETWFIRGGSAYFAAEFNAASRQDDDYPDSERSPVGFRVASAEDGSGGTECGDSVCESPENSLTCPADCPEACGDGICSINEDAGNCLEDCPDECGDGYCTGIENDVNCYVDCGFCGDGICNGWENATTCAPDCAPVCGDGVVESPEECEAGVPLEDSCTSLGFDDGTLSCDVASCGYDTSDCEIACLPRRSFCFGDDQCCSGNCRWFRCR